MIWWARSRRLWAVGFSIAVVICLGFFPALQLTMPSSTAVVPYVPVSVNEMSGLLVAVAWAWGLPGSKSPLGNTAIRPIRLLDICPLLVAASAPVVLWFAMGFSPEWALVSRNVIGICGLTLIGSAFLGPKYAPSVPVLFFAACVFIGTDGNSSNVAAWAFLRASFEDQVAASLAIAAFAIGAVVYLTRTLVRAPGLRRIVETGWG